MTRLEVWYGGLIAHPVIGKLMAKITQEEWKECELFLKAHAGFSKAHFAMAVDKWKLDQPKTKNHSTMWALLTEVASRADEGTTNR